MTCLLSILLFLLLTSSLAHSQLVDSPNGSIESVAVGDDGTVYLGGSFTSWGPQTGGGAALDAVSGAVDMAFPHIDGRVHSVAPDGNGGFYIGGVFSRVGEELRGGLAHIDQHGQVTEWNPDVGYHTVYALAVDGNTVYVGGSFTSVGGTPRNRLAAVLTDGTLTEWNPDANNVIYTLAVHDGTVYVGGTFRSMGGTPRTGLAAIGTDGTLTDWNPDVNSVHALAVHDDTVYVGGSFSLVNGTPRNHLAAVRTDGTLTDWNPGAGGRVNALTVDGSTVYVGGNFIAMGGSPRNSLAAIGTDDTLTDWNPDLGRSEVFALAVSGDTLYVGGTFSSMSGSPRNRLAAIGTDGTLTDWNPDADRDVYALAVDGSKVYAGGDFDRIGGTPRNYLAAIGTDGRLTGWNPDANSTVYELAVDGSTVYVGGAFTSMGGTARNRLAAIGTDGTLTDWNPDADSTVSALAVAGSTVYVGGAFVSMGGTARNRLAAIGTDGTLTDWNPDADSTVSALAVDGSTVYVGGQFTSMGGSPRNYLAAVGADGTLTDWNPDADRSVSVLAVDGGTIYAGGGFTTVGGVTRNRLAAFGSNGALLAAWSPDVTGSVVRRVSALLVEAGTVYVGGNGISGVDGQARNQLAAIDINGTLTDWNPDVDGRVNALAVSGNTLYVGGNFSNINNHVKAGSPPRNLTLLDLSVGAELSSLTLNAGNLSPAFAADVTAYSATVSGSTETMTVSPTLADNNATVTVNGIAVASGQASSDIALDVGENTITVVVTGGIERTITLTVTRLPFPAGDGTEASPWQVATPAQLDAIRDNRAAHFILTADIDLTEATREGGAYWHDGAGWLPIPGTGFTDAFTGSLDGDGFSITGLYINRGSTDNIGLFRMIQGATLTRLTLHAVDITGRTNVGGLAGVANNSNSRIEHSEVTGNVTGTGPRAGGLAGQSFGVINSSYASVAVSGSSLVGGLVGANEGTGAITHSYATAAVSGSSTVGGLVGFNGGAISHSYATGDASGSGDVVGGLVGGQDFGTITSSYATGNVSGDERVGGLLGQSGQASSSITDSYATGDVTGNNRVGGLVGSAVAGTISRSYAIGSVSVSDGGAGTDIGGLVGRSNDALGTITNSYWNTDTSGQDSSAGGTGLTSEQMRDPDLFTGFSFADTWQIQQGFSFPVLRAATQSPAPGLVAPDSPVISSPVNQAAGIVRQPILDWTAASPESAASTASYDVQVSPDAGFSAPIIDQTGITDTQYAVTTDLDAGTAHYWRVRAVNTAGAGDWSQASFTTVPFTEGAGTEASPWQVATADQLDAIHNQLSAHFILVANIDLASVTGDASGVLWNDGKGWQPIGNNSNRFTGSLNGNGFVITGLHIDRPDEDYVGLFGYVAGASITAVAIEGGSVSGGSNVGALAGILAQDSVLTDSHANANVSGTGSRIGGLVGNNSWGTITNSHATGNVDGGDTYIGGLAGSNDWEIFDSYATGNVTGNTRVGGLVGESSYIVTRSYATGDVTATGDFVGGLIGDNLWEVDGSYATGNVVGVENVGGLTGRNSGGEVNNSYATGSVAGDANVGGLVGVNANSDVITSYWNTETSGQNSSAGSDSGYGLTSAQMRQQASFTGFDFDTVWQIDESASYPVLRNNTQTPPPGEFVAPTPPAGPPPGIISSENQGGVFFGEVTINPGGVLNGGQVTGTVQNNGEITGDVILGANTIINGGTVSGNISGNGNQPATINGARITSGASLNNVVIGNNAVLDPDVQLGPNVRFTSPSSIPPGIDLTNALPSHNWAGGDGRSVPDLAGDVIILTDGVPPDSTIDAIRVPAGFEQGQSRQDSDTGELTIISGNVRATMLPGRVRQASTDQEEGIFISEDGDIVLITANGREITSQPVVANRNQFSNVLGELGLESQFGDNASLRLTNPDSGTDNPGFLSVRPEVLSFPATAAEEEGLTFRPVPGLNGATVAVMVYRDEDGNLMQQDLVPVPSDWQSLKSNLTSIEGLSEVRIDTQGIISVTVDGQPVRGQMQYEVTQGGFDDDVPAEGSVLISAGDVNGDGTEDFRVVYADGSSQLMLIFSNAP